MQRIAFPLVVAGLFFPLMALGQMSEEEMLALLEKHDLATAREKVNQVYRQYPGSATAAYFRALLEEEADSAVKLFQDISTRFRGSIYAERALFRMGQYHFARGNYKRAREYFLDLREQYPQSRLLSQAAYYAAKALMIAGYAAAAQEELSDCTEKYPGTWMAKFAAEDLAKLRTPIKHKTSEPEKKPPVQYAVQIGAYARRENAVNQQLAFSQAGYSTQINEKQEGRRVFYQVLVGEFFDRNQARAFADELQKKFKVRCNVVKREGE
ncbi:MAG: SPOR domain-containing protein [candidate division KSB1 bacterium]|nr:SPOR domain-containing protein [candidate division KSB1 bacterium]MDZ7301003.1 SPOR domain-containing protein [candidate division KSB1 bacterium]MDZ7310318.1 SPOR domain-containing protein [candidate division KSB1 bacterium]